MNNRIVSTDTGDTYDGRVSSLPAGLVRASTTKQIVLPPSGFLQIPVTGTKFYIVEQDSGIYIGIKTDRTIEELFTVGTGKAFTEEQYFRTLELRNTSSTATVTLTLFAGFGDYIDRRLTVVDGRFNSVVPVRDAPSLSLAYGATVIGATTTIAFAGTPSGVYKQRKCLAISNQDPSVSLFIRDSAGNNLVTVFPQTTAVWFDSGSLQIRNNAGAPVSCNIGEIWYTG